MKDFFLTSLLAAFAVPLACYDQEVGLMMAYLEKAVYCGQDNFNTWNVGDSRIHGPKVDTSKVRFITRNFTHAAAGVGRMQDPEGCFVAMRGTLGTVNAVFDGLFWLTDFDRKTCSGCQVEFGFMGSYESIKREIFAALSEFGCQDQPLYLVGHSMGAAGITYTFLDALDLGYTVKHIYALESPRPGNPAFSRAVQARAKGIDAVRVAHYQDIVVHLPPSALFFEHALPEIYYNHRTGTDYKQCGIDTNDCSGQWWTWQWTGKDHDWFADIDPCTCSWSSLNSSSNSTMLV
mmetsp:Transcript_74683/g.136419  ORF Transcript_74683/g.136419 Transcript_74683/m.136419 type:complete len:291 (-) Transcript_74683:228-1100(-)